MNLQEALSTIMGKINIRNNLCDCLLCPVEHILVKKCFGQIVLRLVFLLLDGPYYTLCLDVPVNLLVCWKWYLNPISIPYYILHVVVDLHAAYTQVTGNQAIF